MSGLALFEAMQELKRAEDHMRELQQLGMPITRADIAWLRSAERALDAVQGRRAA